MKKLLAIILCIFALVWMVACSSQKGQTEDVASTQDNPDEKDRTISEFTANDLAEFQAYFSGENGAMTTQTNILGRVVNHENINFDNYIVYKTGYEQDDSCEQVVIYWHAENCSLEYHSFTQCVGFWLDLRHSTDGGFSDFYLDDYEQIDENLYSINLYSTASPVWENNNTSYKYYVNNDYRISFTVSNELSNHDAVVAQFVELCEDLAGWLNEGNVVA